MTTFEAKRSVTQEELDAAYAKLPPVIAAPSSPMPSSEVAAEDFSQAVGSIGVHLQKDRSLVVWLSSEKLVIRSLALNQGFEQAESLVVELGQALSSIAGKKIPISFTLSGEPGPTLFADLPRLSRNNLVKALKLQFRTQQGNEPEEIQTLAVGNPKGTDRLYHYFALGIKKDLLEKVVRPLRKQKIRVTAWDADLLCYVRAAGSLWEKSGGGSSTRFLIILEWDHCILLVSDQSKKLLALKLSVGVQSFLQHLVSTRETLSLEQFSELKLESVETRERRLNADQAIHDVYIPFAQQIKTQLFAACNEQGLSLPTHFALVASGANLFQMVESLAHDLSLTPIQLELPSEAVGAYGAALYEEVGLHLNILPRGRGEVVKSFREWLRSSWTKFSPAQSLSDAIPLNAGVLFGIPFLILVGLAAIPVVQRWKASTRLSLAKNEFREMESAKKQITQGKDREALYDKKAQLIKQIELKQYRISSALRELFTAIPPAIRLKSLSFKDGVMTLKGVTTEPSAVESFLKATMDLRLLVEPTPVDVHRDKKNTTFELTFKFRG